jgi:hypothetical protein
VVFQLNLAEMSNPEVWVMALRLKLGGMGFHKVFWIREKAGFGDSWVERN